MGLGTEHIHYRPGLAMVRYPGFKGFPDSGKPHVDNGNNSLLPPSQSNRHHGQLNFCFTWKMWMKIKPQHIWSKRRMVKT